MAYIKNTWVDQKVERPRTYEMINNSDGSVTLVDSLGLVEELGTPVNADNMNHIEDGIVEHENRITVLEEGQDTSRFLNKTQITNCLLEVPQRIKYTLQDGTLTIHAGTVVIFPYGTEDKTSEFHVGSTFVHENLKVYDTQFADGKFFVWAELIGDVIVSPSSQSVATRALSVILSGGGVYLGENTFSGTSTTAGSVNSQYYNTETNYINSSGSTTTINTNVIHSFPIMWLQSSISTGTTSIDQVFNGLGYIGSTVWVDKGVKALASKGRNVDGTLKNVEIVVPKLTTNNIGGNGEFAIGLSKEPNEFNLKFYYKPFVYMQPTEPTADDEYVFWLDTTNNVWKSKTPTVRNWIPQPEGEHIAIVGTETNTPTVITSFTPKQPFRAVNYSDKEEIVTWGIPDYTAGITLSASSFPYTAPTHGVISLVIYVGSSASSGRSLMINDNNVSTVPADDRLQANAFMSKGDIASYATDKTTFNYAYFYPLKGVK